MAIHIKNTLALRLLAIAAMFGAIQCYGAVPLPTPAPSDPVTGVVLQLGVQNSTNLDCSHLVHAVYEKAGLPYRYATSRALYSGRDEFRRVSQPGAGDLIVWRGHVGIVLDPVRHSFLSALRRRIKLSSYVSGYWKKRGKPRFLKFG